MAKSTLQAVSDGLVALLRAELNDVLADYREDPPSNTDIGDVLEASITLGDEQDAALVNFPAVRISTVNEIPAANSVPIGNGKGFLDKNVTYRFRCFVHNMDPAVGEAHVHVLSEAIERILEYNVKGKYNAAFNSVVKVQFVSCIKDQTVMPNSTANLKEFVLTYSFVIQRKTFYLNRSLT